MRKTKHRCHYKFDMHDPFGWLVWRSKCCDKTYMKRAKEFFA